MTASSVFESAQRYGAAGLSVIPVYANGSKSLALADGERKTYEQRLATDEELRHWFGSGRRGIAVLCGAISGHLEALDFDKPGALDEFVKIATDHGASDLVNRLVYVRTPRDPSCGHLWYRCPDGVGRHETAARYEDPNGNPKEKGKIEVRGNGGYCVVPGGPLSVHSSGRPYEVVRGDLCNPPEITAEERTMLLRFARMCDELPPPDEPAYTPQAAASRNGRLSPLDDYNQRGDMGALLDEYRWERTRHPDRFRRPGKVGGSCSASIYNGRLYCWTTNAPPLSADQSYSPASLYAWLRHGGNFSAAAADLRSKGYGDPPEREASMDAPTTTEHLTDLGNARRLIKRHGAKLRYHCERGSWLVWNGKQWVMDNTDRVARLAKETVGAMYAEAAALPDHERQTLVKHALKSEGKAAIGNMIALAASEEGIPVTAEQLDTDRWLLNCRNGTLDLRTGNLREHRAEDLITKITRVDYDPEATQELWNDLLRRVTGGKVEILSYLQMAAGYSLTGSTREDKAFVLVSDGGGGKTSLLEPMKAAMGDYATIAEDSTFLARHAGAAGHSDDVAALGGARLVIATELGQGRLAEERFKRMTGGDSIRASRKHERSFEFTPTFKLWMAMNKPIRADDEDTGVWRRLRYIPWIPIPPQDRDPKVKEILMRERDALKAVLAWMVAGCLRYHREGLGDSPAIEEATEVRREENNPMAAFFNDCCIFDPDVWVHAGQLRTAYEEWCREDGSRPVAGAEYSRRLHEKGAENGRNYKHGRHWVGVGLRETERDMSGMSGHDRSSPHVANVSSHEENIWKTPDMTRHACHADVAEDCNNPSSPPAVYADYEPGQDG